MGRDLELKGRIAILGSGREGLAAYNFIDALGTADSLEVLTEGLSGREQEAQLGVRGLLKVCRFSQVDLRSYDVLVRSPGVSVYRQSLRAAAAAGVRITSPSSIWFRTHPEASTIVISGTKGKSTTSALLAHMLDQLGVAVRLAGNIGTPLLACDDGGVDWWVIELSSFQLADLEAEPTIGVLLNLETDHLDWHGSEEQYHADKLRLADLVKPGCLIANGVDKVLKAALSGRPEVRWFTPQTSAGMMPASLPGSHNRANLAACLAVIEHLGMDRDRAGSALASFEGLTHRFQRLGASGGVTFINDSISSAPMATVAALEALQDDQVVLIVGGFDRGIEWAPYAESMRVHPPAGVVALPDNGPGILSAILAAGIDPPLGAERAEDLRAAVKIAREMAPEGSVILLSPGAPSFPHFRDYEDRGKQFASLCGMDLS